MAVAVTTLISPSDDARGKFSSGVGPEVEDNEDEEDDVLKLLSDVRGKEQHCWCCSSLLAELLHVCSTGVGEVEMSQSGIAMLIFLPRFFYCWCLVATQNVNIAWLNTHAGCRMKKTHSD